MVPFVAAMATGLFFTSLLFKIYALALVGALAAVVIFVRWAVIGGLRASHVFTREVAGRPLQTHHVARGAPGDWGVSLCLVADGALLGALFFGYVFLWLVAPAWPPPAWVDIAWLPTAVALLALAMAGWQSRSLACVSSGGSKAESAAEDAPRSARWLVFCWFGWIAGFGAILALLMHAPSADSHAYGAVTRVLYCYVLLHIVVAALMLGVAQWRMGNRYFASSQCNLDARVYAVWARYTVVTGMLVVGAVAAMGALS